MNKIIKKIENIKEEEIKKVFIELLKNYLSPSFASMSKKEFDVLLFTKIRTLGVIEDMDVYDIASSLKITVAKAKNLLAESDVRYYTEEDLKIELKQVLSKPIFIKNGDKIGFEILKPSLKEYVKKQMRDLGYITDSSFSSDIINTTLEAYSSLFEKFVPNENKEKLKSALVKCGAKADKNLKNVLMSAFGQILNKFLGNVAEDLTQELFEFLPKLFEGIVPEKIKKFMQNDSEKKTN